MALTPTFAPPYIGATVVLVDPDMGDFYPGIVTRVLNEEKGRVNVTAFPPGVTPYAVRQAYEFSADEKVKGSWHWGEVAKRSKA
jgi:hypothetical protein